MNTLINFYTSPYEGDFNPQDFFRTNITIFIPNIETKLTKSPKDLTKLVDLIVNNFQANQFAGDIFLTNLRVLGLNEEDYTVYPDDPYYWQANYRLEELQPTLLFLVDTREQTLKLAYLPSSEIYYLEKEILLSPNDHIDIRTLFANLEAPESALSVYFDRATKGLSESEREKLTIEFDQIADKLAVYDSSKELSKEAVANLDDAYINALYDTAKMSETFVNFKLELIEEFFLTKPDEADDPQLKELSAEFQRLIAKTPPKTQEILKNYQILHDYLATFGKYYEFCLDEDKFNELLDQDYDPNEDSDYN